MRRITLFLAISAVFLFCGRISAQVETQSTLTGIVVDTTGAVIPGATVTAVQEETHLVRTTVSNQTGVFEIGGLPVGTYSVKITQPGMKTWEVNNLNLPVGTRLKLSPTLAIGPVEQTVEVSADELIATEDSSVSEQIDMEAMRDFPLNTRNPLGSITFLPGMYYEGQGGPEGGAQIRGNGLQDSTTTYSLDGINVNAPMDYGAIAIPVIDDVAGMKVSTADGSAMSGHDPMQVDVITKSGSNDFHGVAWEFFQNDDLNAIQRFAVAKPRVRFNQFGGNLGGPIVKDHTFFFGSFQSTINPGQTVFNEFAPLAKRLQGDFSGYPANSIKDPTTGQPFPDNIIPPDRINPASSYLAQFLPVANTVGGPYGSLFRALASDSNNTYQSTLRLDHNINQKQRIYMRAVSLQNRAESPGYLPTVQYNNSLDQSSFGANYNYQITPALSLTATAGYTQTANWFSSPQVGHTNYAAQAGLQGIPTDGATCCIGFPDIVMAGGYPGIGMPFGVNGKLWGNTRGASADFAYLKQRHSIGFGYQLNDPAVYGKHGSYAPRGQFVFFNSYSGDGLADFLLGYSSAAEKNLPLNTFGLSSRWQNAWHAEDSWKVKPSLTLNFGGRVEYWAAPHFVAGNAATFDPALGKVVVGEDNGHVNYSQQPVSAAIAAALPDLMVTQSEAKIDHMIPTNTVFQPRVGFAWQPFWSPGRTNQIVVHGGYGVYDNIFVGNRAASDIASIPFFDLQFKALSTSQLVDWRQFFPADPANFYQPSVAYTTSLNIKASKTQDWNLGIEVPLPQRAVFQMTYLGTKAQGQPGLIDHDAPPPGVYSDLQSARPYPQYGSISLVENAVTSWYHALQLQVRHDTYKGLYYGVNYTWSKSMSNHYGATWELSSITPYAPAWYERGETNLSLPNVLNVQLVYDLPVGRGRQFFSSMNRALDLALGGWEFSSYYTHHSGDALTMGSYSPLGNGYYSRSDLVGNPSDNSGLASALYPGGRQWFNPKAFAAPAPTTWGTSPVGVIRGPGLNFASAILMKNFAFSKDHSRYLQLGAEAYNFPNATNYNDPDTTVGDTYFGQILSAGPARSVQLRGKIYF